jgi:hypothetical protein
MKHILRAVFCLSLTLAAGCSNFEKRFAAASQVEGPLKTGPYAGAYSGTWTSANSSVAGGKLRCILTPIDGRDYRADFHATWHGVFSSEHSVVLKTRPAGKTKAGGPAADFGGTSVLKTPVGSGTYTTKGRVDFRGMRACYDATYDRGTMELARVQPASTR